eukprot:22026-Chlamydomonas_euryale.AAC.3
MLEARERAAALKEQIGFDVSAPRELHDKGGGGVDFYYKELPWGTPAGPGKAVSVALRAAVGHAGGPGQSSECDFVWGGRVWLCVDLKELPWGTPVGRSKASVAFCGPLLQGAAVASGTGQSNECGEERW